MEESAPSAVSSYRVLEETILLVRDDVFPRPLVNAANAEWPASDWQHWHAYGYGDGDRNALKYATKDESRITSASRALLYKMSELQYAIIPRQSFPDLSYHGAGMHELPDGGYLNRHLDSDSYSQRPKWRRAASGVLYLNDDFDGGNFCLELPDKTVQKIQPRQNRLVIFRSTESAYHWVEKVTGGNRRTLAIFWWCIGDGDVRRSKAAFSP